MTDRIAFTLLALLVFTAPWEKSWSVAGVGTITKALGLLTFVAGTVAVIARRGIRVPNLALALSAAFVISSGCTWFWSYDPDATALRTATQLQLLVMLLLIWDFCRTSARQAALMSAYVMGACVASAATLVRYAANLQTYYRRYAAPGFDPNDLGVTVAMALPMALYLSTRVSGPKVWLWRLAVLLCSAAVLLTASRTALIGAVLGFGFVPISWQSTTAVQRISGLVLLAVLLAGSMALAPKASRERIATISREVRSGTLHNRTVIWKAGLRAWKSRRLTGIGAGAYPDAVQPIIGIPGVPGHEYVAHNTLLSVLVETGLIGLGIYVLYWATLLTFILVMRQRELAVWLCTAAVWASGAFALTWEHRKPSWLLAGLIMTEWARAFRPEQSS